MNQEKIGGFIAALRKGKKLTQEDLANKLNINSRSISRWETGKCMPDLSLLIPLSRELGITVNDLMNGEILDKKDYQESFENNIVKTISQVNKSNRNWNILYNAILGFILFFIISFITYIFMNNYGFVMDYNPKTMEISLAKEDYEVTPNRVSSTIKSLEFIVYNAASINSYHLITTYKNTNNETIGVIFVTTTETIKGSIDRKNIYKDCYDLTNCGSNSHRIEIYGNKFPLKYEVYYTTVSRKKIANANNAELLKIIAESNLMYEEK